MEPASGRTKGRGWLHCQLLRRGVLSYVSDAWEEAYSAGIDQGFNSLEFAQVQPPPPTPHSTPPPRPPPPAALPHPSTGPPLRRPCTASYPICDRAVQVEPRSCSRHPPPPQPGLCLRLAPPLPTARFRPLARISPAPPLRPATLLQALYSLVIMLLYLRFIDALTFSNSLGVLAIILGQIVRKDLRQWFGLVIFVTIAFAMSFTILMPGAMEQEVSSARPLYIPFWRAPPFQLRSGGRAPPPAFGGARLCHFQRRAPIPRTAGRCWATSTWRASISSSSWARPRTSSCRCCSSCTPSPRRSSSSTCSSRRCPPPTTTCTSVPSSTGSSSASR